MQQDSDTFFRRTEALSDALKCNAEGLVPLLGLSRASFFSYRSGKRPITRKAWRKLEDAEAKVEVARQMGLRINPETGEMESAGRAVQDAATTKAWLKMVRDLSGEIAAARKETASAEKRLAACAEILRSFKKSLESDTAKD